jgi:hypothetical protein
MKQRQKIYYALTAAVLLIVVFCGTYLAFPYFRSFKKIDPALRPFEQMHQSIQPLIADQQSIGFYSDDKTGETTMRAQFFFAPIMLQTSLRSGYVLCANRYEDKTPYDLDSAYVTMYKNDFEGLRVSLFKKKYVK